MRNEDLLTMQKRTLELIAKLPGFEECSHIDIQTSEGMAAAVKFTNRYNEVGRQFEGDERYQPILDEIRKLESEYQVELAESRGGVQVGIAPWDDYDLDKFYSSRVSFGR